MTIPENIDELLERLLAISMELEAHALTLRELAAGLDRLDGRSLDIEARSLCKSAARVSNDRTWIAAKIRKFKEEADR